MYYTSLYILFYTPKGKKLSIASRPQADQIVVHLVVKVEIRRLERSPNWDFDLAAEGRLEAWQRGRRWLHATILMKKSEAMWQTMQMKGNGLELTAGQRLGRGVVILPEAAKGDERHR
jgi:hypothetical protein